VSKSAPKQAKRKHAPRRPSVAPWPPYGFVTVEQMMAALGAESAQTVYTRINDRLLPAPERIGPTRVGWRVDVARAALDALPAKAAALRAQRQRERHAQRQPADGAQP
jgi:predicted DNA-binding transcriptional regulator AlpA